MKIGIIVSVFLPSTIAGGVTSVAADHAMELSSRGHMVTVLTSNVISLHPPQFSTPGEEISGNLRIQRFSSSVIFPHFSLIFSSSLLHWLKIHAREFDVFHIHYARELFTLSTTDLLQHIGKKVFLQSHGMLNRREGLRNIIDAMIVKNQLQRSSAVFALQSNEQEVQIKISPHSNIVILPNGINPIGLPSWNYDNTRSVKSILFLSRLHPRKKVLDFIHAAKIILSSRLDVEFLIVGPDGGDLEKAKQLIQMDNLLNSHIVLVGSVKRDEALNYLANADIYVLPSIDEPFPMIVLEALAVGVPCVVTDRVHIVDLLQQYDAAEVVSPGPSSLAQGIIKLLSDPELCLHRSMNGRELVNSKLSISKVISQLEAYYALQ